MFVLGRTVRCSGTIVLVGCLLWLFVCCKNSLVLDFVYIIAVAGVLIRPSVGSWQ